MIRKSSLYLFSLSLLVLLTGVMFTHAGLQARKEMDALSRKAGLVQELALTDLCIFTEARYTRHPSQADRHSAFQDHPLSMEHFPSGSLLALPEVLKEQHADLD
jgi:hypothetical protein